MVELLTSITDDDILEEISVRHLKLEEIEFLQILRRDSLCFPI